MWKTLDAEKTIAATKIEKRKTYRYKHKKSVKDYIQHPYPLWQ